MSEKIVIDGAEYNKLEVLKIKVDGEDKQQLSEEDTKDKDNIKVNIIVKAE